MNMAIMPGSITETFIESYPKPTAGSPIRKATPEERLRRDHANVGRLSEPALFEVAEILLTSGLSGKKRDKFLKLNQVSDQVFYGDEKHDLPHTVQWLYAVEEQP
jgi:hypothetical protein